MKDNAMRLWAGVQLFVVGAFAGAIASFFPRLVALLGGDPTKGVVLFSGDYFVVGGIVAAVVGLIIVIIESDSDRKKRDVFMTALGVPTLLMGALSANATSNNVAELRAELKAVSTELARSAGIVERPAAALERGAIAPSSGWSPSDLLISRAVAQGSSAAATTKQNSLGIGARQSDYYVVFDEAPTAEALESTQRTILKSGVNSRVIRDANGGWLLVPSAHRPMPYSEAVREAVRAKELGAKAFLIPVRN